MLRIFCLLFIIALITNAASLDAKGPAGDGITLLDAVSQTLVKQPDILIQEQEVEVSRGRFQEASGQFDSALALSAGHNHGDIPLSTQERLGLAFSSNTVDVSSAKMELTKQFRTGITIDPSVTVTRTELNPNSGFQPVNLANVEFLITFPLLKGRGTEATAAVEMSRNVDYKASLLTFHHLISQGALNTVLAYWSYLAASKNLVRLKESEESAERLLEDTRELVKADEYPASELEAVLASLADKRGARVAGEQSLFEARQILGLAMGISGEEISALPSPADGFPKIEPNEVARLSASGGSLIEMSLSNRADYQASKEHEKSANILLKGAKNNLLPQLDMQLGFGYNGLEEGRSVAAFTGSLENNVPGASASLSFRYQWPFNNNTAKGQMAQKSALYQESVISTRALERTIYSGVAVAMSALRNNIIELAKSREAVQSYEKSVRNEKQKLQLGVSTVLDVIQLEDRLTNAFLTEISAELKLATALASLRFQSGTLLAFKDDRVSVGKEELTTIPHADQIQKQ